MVQETVRITFTFSLVLSKTNSVHTFFRRTLGDAPIANNKEYQNQIKPLVTWCYYFKHHDQLQ
ncbi:hypothetical protein AHF37_01728 [Paragonimus kellicotti]|nr:hypothetical protein AHF37_01728 [Paragonimus kellicotti]